MQAARKDKKINRGEKMETAQKTWVVTGGAGGIGRAIAEKAIKEGAFVCVIDKDQGKGQELALEYGPQRLFYYQGDLKEKQVLENFTQALLQKRGKVDVLVNNACYSLGGLPQCSYEQALEVLKVGALAPYALVQLLHNHFTPGGSVINITSTRAFMSQGGTESYTMAKGALSALTHGLSISLGGKVRVNAIAPGWIETAPKATHQREDELQHPVKRVGRPQDIAELAWFLAGEGAGFITGHEFVADGGMTKQMIYHGDQGWQYQEGGC